MIETLKAQIVNKGKEISEYMDKHNIQIRQEQVMQQGGGDVQDANSKGQSNDTIQSTSGVLVDSSSQKSWLIFVNINTIVLFIVIYDEHKHLIVD